MRFMLDCELEPASISSVSSDSASTSPVLRTARLDAVDLALIDIILISQHSTMLGLPYITEYAYIHKL